MWTVGTLKGCQPGGELYFGMKWWQTLGRALMSQISRTLLLVGFWEQTRGLHWQAVSKYTCEMSPSVLNFSWYWHKSADSKTKGKTLMICNGTQNFSTCFMLSVRSLFFSLFLTNLWSPVNKTCWDPPTSLFFSAASTTSQCKQN